MRGTNYSWGILSKMSRKNKFLFQRLYTTYVYNAVGCYQTCEDHNPQIYDAQNNFSLFHNFANFWREKKEKLC